MKNKLLVLIIIAIIAMLVAQSYTTRPVCKKQIVLMQREEYCIKAAKITCQYRVCNYNTQLRRFVCSQKTTTQIVDKKVFGISCIKS